MLHCIKPSDFHLLIYWIWFCSVLTTEDASDGRYPPGSRVSSNGDFAAPQTRKKPTLTTRSTPPDSSFPTIARNRSPLKATVQKVNGKKPLNWRVDISVPCGSATVTGACENTLQRRNNGNVKSAKSEIKRSLFGNKNFDDKPHKFGGSKSGSRVAPCREEGPESTVVSNASENLHVNHKDCEDLSLIRNQLVQIEKQQSSLLDLLQVCFKWLKMNIL